MSSSMMASAGDDVVAFRMLAFDKAVEQFRRALANDPSGLMLWRKCITVAWLAAARKAVSDHR